jgi:hypothetical protein
MQKPFPHFSKFFTCFFFLVISQTVTFAESRLEKCQQTWNSMISFSRPGHYDVYKIDSHMQSPHFSRTTKTIQRAEIEEVSDEQLVSSYESTIDGQRQNPTKTTLTKKQFLQSCQQMESGQSKPEVLETGTRTVTVPAGTFVCQYQKTKLTQSMAGFTTEVISETYQTTLPSGYHLLVKSQSESQMMMGMKNTVQQELLEYRR